MAINPAMNAATAGSVFGGSHTASQGSILGQMYPHGAVGQERRIEHMFDHVRQINVTIVSADNGFILVTKPEYGNVGRVVVASTIEELRDLITSEMVTRKMEK